MKKTSRFFVMTSILFALGISNIVLPTITFAQNLEIIPEAQNKDEVVTSVKTVGDTAWSVRKNYNSEAERLAAKHDIWAQMASGIMNWDTILDYVAYLIKFLSQAGIFVWALMIVYAGYIYASTAFTGGDISSGKTAIKNAITGVVIIAFSYAIMRVVVVAFLS